MVRYTQGKLRQVATQIYGEMRHIKGNNPVAIKSTLESLYNNWSPETEEDFKRSFPGQDPELCRQAGVYLIRHFSEIADANDKVTVQERDLIRFGFKQ